MNTRIEEELFPFYALEALTPEEKAEVDAYIAADPAAKARLNELQKAANALPMVTDPIMPSAQVKANLMARVQADSRAVAQQIQPVAVEKPRVERPSPIVPTKFSWWERLRQGFAIPTLAGAAALAAIILFIWAISLNQQIERLEGQVADLMSDTQTLVDQLETLQTDNDQLRVRNDALQQQLSTQNDILASYQTPGANTIAIGDITGEHPEAIATLTVSPEGGRATFVAANLLPLSAEQVYQLWIIRGDQPMSAGIFEVDENGQATLQVDWALASVFDAVGVSIEPAGGSEQPTNVILLGAPS